MYEQFGIFTNESSGETGEVATWMWNFNGEGFSSDKSADYPPLDQEVIKTSPYLHRFPDVFQKSPRPSASLPGPLTGFGFKVTYVRMIFRF